MINRNEAYTPYESPSAHPLKAINIGTLIFEFAMINRNEAYTPYESPSAHPLKAINIQPLIFE